VRVISEGPLFALGQEFFIDPLNVFLVTLTAFVGLTTALFSRPYMRVERDHGKMTPNRLRLYHSMYQLFAFTMLLALTTNNMGILWVAMEAATLTTVLLVSVLPHRRQPGGRLEVLHPVRRGHRPGAVRHGAAVHGVGAGAGFGRRRAAVDPPRPGEGPARPEHHDAGLRLLLVATAPRWPGAPAQLAARRARRGPDARLRRAVGLLLNVALYAVLRSKVLADGALRSHLAAT